jgi:hypothetical protein
MMFKTAIPSLIGLTTTIALLTPSSALALTGFTGVYAPSNFTFNPTPSEAGTEGTDLDTTGAGAGTVILYSPDGGVNGLGTTAATIDWRIPITAAREGTISFDWSYEPFDLELGDDSAFYLLNGTPFLLASNNGTTDPQNSASAINLAVTNGDIFGFRVSTQTNTGGSGVFTVNNFEFVATPVPFETDASLGLLVLGGLYGGHRWLKSRSNSPLS